MDYSRGDLEDAFGERFGGFKLLGKGGEGAVFSVYDRVKKVDLALKLSRDSGDPGHYERFEREYQILAGTRSDRLVRVFEHGRVVIRAGQGSPARHFWYTMEKCDASVRQTYKTMTLAVRLTVALQMLDGLALLHAKNIAHRDIKPENLFLVTGSRGGPSVKIGDFGIATVARVAPNAVAGAVYGSPAYLAPERWRAESDDDWRPADQYAAGVTVYELLSLGQPPLDFKPTFEEAHASHPVLPLKIPEMRGWRLFATDAVIKRMLAKVPEWRHPDVASCKRELEAALLHDGVTGQ